MYKAIQRASQWSFTKKPAFVAMVNGHCRLANNLNTTLGVTPLYLVSQLMRSFSVRLTVDICTVLKKTSNDNWKTFLRFSLQKASATSENITSVQYLIVKIMTSPARKSVVFHCPPNRFTTSVGSVVNQPVPVNTTQLWGDDVVYL